MFFAHTSSSFTATTYSSSSPCYLATRGSCTCPKCINFCVQESNFVVSSTSSQPEEDVDTCSSLSSFTPVAAAASYADVFEAAVAAAIARGHDRNTPLFVVYAVKQQQPVEEDEDLESALAQDEDGETRDSSSSATGCDEEEQSHDSEDNGEHNAQLFIFDDACCRRDDGAQLFHRNRECHPLEGRGAPRRANGNLSGRMHAYGNSVKSKYGHPHLVRAFRNRQVQKEFYDEFGSKPRSHCRLGQRTPVNGRRWFPRNHVPVGGTPAYRW